MANSRRIAGLLGPILVAMSVSEMTTADIWAAVTPPQVYLAGLLWFIAGLTIVRAHNRWKSGWPLLVTVMGWFFTLGGLLRMFSPRLAQQPAENPVLVLGGQMTLLVIGVVLTLKAYSRNTGVGHDAE